MSPTLAIDFGSSRTKVAYFCTDAGKPKVIELGQEIRAIIPSVFYIPQQGPVLIGDDAAQMADEDPSGIVTDIKRELHRPSKIRCGEGRPAYQRWELVSHLFSEIRRRCGEEVFHTGPSSDCILTVPVCFSEPQRQKLREAAQHAGFTNVRLLEEPIAAAMHWLSSSGKSVSDHVIVVDIGGGTTDLAALKLSGEIYESIPDLPSSGFACGGNDIDEDVRRALQKDLACDADDSGGLLLKLRQVKERLVKMDRDVFTLSVSGKAQTIQRNVVESAVRTLVEKTSIEVARFLKDYEEVTGRRDTPMLLAGGGSKLKGMKEALVEIAGRDRVFIWNDGEYAIVLGAAVACASKGKPSPPSSSLRPRTEDKAEAANSSPSKIDDSIYEDLVKLQAILTSPQMGSLEKLHAILNSSTFNACVLEANQGNAMAQALLGHCYLIGWGVSQNYAEAVKWFRLAADQGDADAQTNLGHCYLNGWGVSQNHTEAVKWYRLAADQGNAVAQTNLGFCYYNGRGVSQNDAEAVKWYRLAADKGDAEAGKYLGLCYYNGRGVSQNDAEAVKWFRLVADQGDAEAQFGLGCFYSDGFGVSQDHVEAVKWYRLAADQGNSGSQLQFGHCYFNGLGVSQNHTEAVKWYRLAADQGNAEAQKYLGVCYINGLGVSQNPTEAVKWYWSAADQGDAESQKYLGDCYFNGWGVPEDKTKAVTCFRLAADQGLASAQYVLGLCYYDEFGVRKNKAEAVTWFRRAAEQGSKEAQVSLGFCYYQGIGVPENLSEAVTWFRQAAEQGDEEAQFFLGTCYDNGYGVRKDKDEAKKWFSLAGAQGSKKALERIGSHAGEEFRNGLKKFKSWLGV